jgi:membrane protein
MAAAIAFRGVFSLVPLVYLLSVIFSWTQSWFGPLVSQLGLEQFNLATFDLNNYWEAAGINTYLEQVIQSQLTAHIVSIGVGLVIILFGAIGVFNELIVAINLVWGKSQKLGLVDMLRQRLLAVGFIAGLAGLTLVSIALRSLLGVVEAQYLYLWPNLEWVRVMGGWLMVGLLTGLLMASINRYVPRVEIAWVDVLPSAIASTPLVLIGQLLLSWYLHTVMNQGNYGGFGIYIAFMLWVYYSAIMLLFSVHLTRVLTEKKRLKSLSN